jgi:hypothetical protein
MPLISWIHPRGSETVCVQIFASFGVVEIHPKMLPSKPKCIFSDAALGKTLLKIDTILTKAMLFPLHSSRLHPNIHVIWKLFTVQARRVMWVTGS